MAATSNKSDAAFMAWYRAKKFGVARPRFKGYLPTPPVPNPGPATGPHKVRTV